MPQHGEAPGRGRERLRLLMDGCRRTPPPSLMDERTMCRIHEADDGMVHRAGEVHDLGEIGDPVADIRHNGDIRRVGGVGAEKHPDIALHLARGISAYLDPARVDWLPPGSHRNGDPPPPPPDPPPTEPT